jgi:hypothetical protein
MATDFHPHHHDGGYLSWSIPSQCWSGGEWSEDTIKLVRNPDGSWHGCTEHDQCVKRDLDQPQIDQIREELGLSA